MNASEQQKEATLGGKMPKKKPYPYMAPVLSDYGKLTEVTQMATVSASVSTINLSAADVIT
ncbi:MULTISPECIES: hypothetical protein [Methylococcus]|jgi:hypothetical protein|uniref:Uncharacterized protein n=1 Tax=Methylococcus capsulatus TaxID=414 RepID=A0AA35XSP6_METCP|nr:hypothetical protein [Methylococcus capsulatus]CAI8738662.1 protein of unknown function [Methylococcus capsulatus]